VVEAVMRYQLIPPDFVPFSCRCDVGRAESIDAQADGGSPRDCILHELHLSAVVGEKERTRSFQSLFGHDLLVCLYAELSPHGAIRPNDTNDLSTCLFAQPEMKLRSRDRLFLH